MINVLSCIFHNILKKYLDSLGSNQVSVEQLSFAVALRILLAKFLEVKYLTLVEIKPRCTQGLQRICTMQILEYIRSFILGQQVPLLNSFYELSSSHLSGLCNHSAQSYHLDITILFYKC